MNAQAGVTLQINLAPADLPHATYTVPHQLRRWGGQVSEILFVVDLHRSRGKYAEGFDQRLPGLRDLIEEWCATHRHARSVDVDYSPGVADHLASTYFGGATLPLKDWNGAPFYSYFYGLDAARHDYVFHNDSDMMYGGGSQTWIAEAVRLLRQRPEILACSPLPGPPTSDGRLTSQTLEPEPLTSLAFRATGISTRLFLIDRSRLTHRVRALTPTRPGRLRVWQARADGNPPYDFAETVISNAMAKEGLTRIDFLGDPPGMWSLHPPHRSDLFYARLPGLIEMIETGQVPEGQRGDHDINSSMIDWSSARMSMWMKVVKHQRLLAGNVAGKMSGAR